MKGTGKLLMIVVATVATFTIGNRVGAVSAQRQNLGENIQVPRQHQNPVWEYRVIPVSGHIIGEKILNDMGAQGWELVTTQSAMPSGAMPVQSRSFFADGYYFFKRAKQ